MALVPTPTSPVMSSCLSRPVSLKAFALTPTGTATYATGHCTSPLMSHAAILSSPKLMIPPLLPSTWDLPPRNYVPIPIPPIPSGSLTSLYPIALITLSTMHSICTWNPIARTGAAAQNGGKTLRAASCWLTVDGWTWPLTLLISLSSSLRTGSFLASINAEMILLAAMHF